ncbi:TIM barrel protein [candidate division KSB1 bacterium]|nr:TIM barrel protein [candidate division KSB1 bacterium]
MGENRKIDEKRRVILKVSAFADEISDDLQEQIKHLKANNVGFIELRSVAGKNVLDLSRSEIEQIRNQASDEGIGFSAIGSPLGKFPLDGYFTDQLDGLKKALDYAARLNAPYIRMFSFYIPKDENPAQHRSQVLDWLGKMALEAEKTDIVLAHENESGIYGDTGDRCLDIYEQIKSDSFTGIFDFANFVQCNQHPYQDCWLKIKSYISYFHIKDAMITTGEVVPPGKGDGAVETILTEAIHDGFDNFLTLEPHLSVAEANYGKTTSDLFKTATDALKEILDRI